MSEIPQFSNILAAKQRIASFVHHTPVLTSKSINHILGAEIYFKCENFQKVGAFKFRGATNAILNLSNKEVAKGVATHSSGNHAAALALAAKNKGIPAYIVMPENAPGIKKKAVAGYGAKIVYCEPTLQAREIALGQVIRKTGAYFIHPYDNFDVICGQGTAALELMEEIDDLEIVMAPVGGGGLLSGSAISVKEINSKCKVYAAEPEMADDAYKSFKSGKLVPSVNPKTIADGLLTSLSNLTFNIINNKVDDILLVDEKSIVHAMKMVWERMKIIIEPSSSVPLAAILKNSFQFKSKKIGIIISGGNVDLSNLPF
ncbi:MAG: pyridoxal-phosphate dependent enzyme [Chlorobi bacterium]|nr:pyridoxal-phosphate dependent enzyme [Chlorobiota bacterium]